MKKFLIGLGFALFYLSARAQASICTIPNVIANGAVVDATPVMQNFNALVSCSNNIDWQNIDASGIFASQIIPTTPGQATFGGSVSYTFNQHVFFEDSIVIDSTASPPTTGVEGGNVGNAFVITSVAGSAAPNGVRFVVTTALPSSAPPYVFNYGGTTLFEVDAPGDGIFQGGIAFDGQAPDGTSLIGGVSATPFWLKSMAGSGAGANFAFLDHSNTPPSIVVENAGASVIFTVDGVGDVQAKGAIALDNATPAAEGLAGGTGTGAFQFFADNSAGAYAFAFKDIGGSTNLMSFVNSSASRVVSIDEVGGITIGASGQTDIEPTSAAFGGSVALPTVGPNNVVCTGGSSLAIACSGSTVNMYDFGSGTPIALPNMEKGIAVCPITNHGYTNFPDLGGSIAVTFTGFSFSNTSYAVTVTGESRNVIYTVSGKSTSGFTINCDVFSNYAANVNVDFVAAGK